MWVVYAILTKLLLGVNLCVLKFVRSWWCSFDQLSKQSSMPECIHKHTLHLYTYQWYNQLHTWEVPLFHFLCAVKNNSKLITLGYKTIAVDTQPHSPEGALPTTQVLYISLDHNWWTRSPWKKAGLDIALFGSENEGSLTKSHIVKHEAIPVPHCHLLSVTFFKIKSWLVNSS